MWPSRSALIALHYQNEVLHPQGKIRLGIAEDGAREDLLSSARHLLDNARARRVPLVHVRIAFPRGFKGMPTNAPIFQNVVASGACEEGGWGAEFHAGFEPLPGEIVVTHDRVNAFFRSHLEEQLRQLDVNCLVMAGVATNSVVEHSARHAADMGYQVIVVADACSAARRDVHLAALDNIALIGTVRSRACLTEGGSA